MEDKSVKIFFGGIIIMAFISITAISNDIPFLDTQDSINKIEMIVINGPPTPPIDTSNTIVEKNELPKSAVILNNVPTSEWTYGCTATAAGMLFGYYDRTNYPNMYTGPTNGGVCPLTNLGQGYPGNPNYPIPGSCYIIATEKGLDGITSNAHVDDYWISYQSPGPDPWEGNWTEHNWELCVADFLGTNQWKWDFDGDGDKDSNVDGATTVFYNTDGSKLYDYIPPSSAGTPQTACCHGLKLFAESRGYTVATNYNQLTDNQNPNGFTFADFQAEINAGRPVLIHLEGHTVLGVGYDASTNTVYIHDTWDNYLHNMTWGGSYAGMEMMIVTVLHLDPPPPPSITYVDDDYNASTPGWQYDHFASIQDAINAVAENGTVYVYNGTYYENVIVNKTISLIGEDKNTTIIDGSGRLDVVKVTADNVTIEGFTIRNGHYGIELNGVYESCARNNCIVGCWGSIYLDFSRKCLIENNTMFKGGIMIYGGQVDYWNTHFISSNTINGKPILYWKDVTNGIVPSGAGEIIIANCSNVLIENQEIENVSVGVEIGFSINCSIVNNIFNNTDCGVRLHYSDNFVVNNNSFLNNGKAIHLFYSDYGHIYNNTIKKCSEGVWLTASDNNIISNNILTKNGYGIYTCGAINNLIYNNYFNNNVNAYDNGNNKWNISKTAGTNIIGGPFLGGNYWHDYNGIDTDGDGLGDTMVPYNCNGDITNGGDWLPLITVNNPPSEPSKPSGETNCHPGINYTYSTVSTDPDGDNIKYGWDWNGDDIVDEWTEWYASGETCYITHLWNSTGTYNVKVKAVDTDGAESQWSENLTVTITPNNPPNEPSDPWPNGVIRVSTSSNLSCLVTDPDGDSLTVFFYWANGTLIDVDNVASGERAIIYPDLEEDTYYEWYVIVNDGQLQTQSSTWSFGTSATAPHIVAGYCYYGNESHPAAGINVTIINDCNNETINVKTDEYGYYNVNLGAFGGIGWPTGTPITVIAKNESGGWYGEESGYVPYMLCWINITMIQFNNPPIANFSFIPSSPTTQDTIRFIDSSYDTDGFIIDYIWNFGDGNVSRAGKCISFDGIDDYVDCGNDPSLNITDAITIEAWIKTNAANGHRFIVTKWPGFSLESYRPWATNGRFVLYIDSAARVLNFNTNVSDGKWHHVIATYDSSTATMKVYIDGVLDNSKTLTGLTNYTISMSGANLYIGKLWGYYFNGSIDDVRIYNRALSADEVYQNYIGNVTTTGLVSWWKFDGNANDCIGGNDGIVYGCSYETYGEYAMEFDGIDDYVDCGNDPSLNITDAITIEAWIKTNAANGHRFIVTKWPGFSLESYRPWATNGRFVLYIDSAARVLNFNTNVSDGKWHHVIATYDSSTATMKVYIDGVLDNSKTLTGLTNYTISMSGANLYIGKLWGYYFNGSIDDVRIYNRALSADEVYQNYIGNVTTTGLVSWWKFDGNANDCIGGNDGIVHGGKWQVIAKHKYAKAGTYNVTLTVIDDDNAKASVTKEVVVASSANNPPIANFSYIPSSPTTQDTIRFIDSSYDTDGFIIDYIWNFGDGNVSRAGKCISFDGIDDYVGCGNDPSLNITDAITIEAWIKTNAANGHRFIVTKWPGFSLESYRPWATNGRFVLYIDSAARVLNFNTNVSDGKWHHVIATYDSSTATMKVYIDGVLDNSKTLTGLTNYTISMSGANLYIGKLWGYYFNGSIDDVRIYNRALSADEVYQNYIGNVTTTGLVSWWKFDGNANDCIGNNDGIVYGCSYETYGEYAMEFDGIDDYVGCGNDPSLNITDAITIEAWIKTNAANGHRFIVTKWPGFSLESYRPWATNGRFVLYIDSAARVLNFNTNVSDGKWHHVIATYDSSTATMKVYIDGVLDNSKTLTGLTNYTISMSGANLYIGKLWGYYFNGSIDDVRIYNRALSADEVYQNYIGNVTLDGLVSWWKFDGNANDCIGGNDGIVHGGKWQVIAKHKYAKAGTYNVTLTVIDDDGAKASVTKKVVVT